MKEFIEKNRYFLAVMALAVLSILVSYFYIGYKHELVKDAAGYFEAAKFLQGGSVLGPDTPMNRVLTTPLFLYASNFINFFLKDFILSVAVLNLIFYFLCVAAFYLLASEIYERGRAAFWGTALFAANFYLIDPGNAHLADMGGWFFFILSLFLAVRYFKATDRKFYYLSILAAALGVLYKEYGGLGISGLALLILFSDIPARQKIKDIALAALLFLAPLAAYHAFIFLKFDYSYWDWYLTIKAVSVEATRQARGFILQIKILGWLFSLGWLAWFSGLTEEIKAGDRTRRLILTAVLLPALLFLVWPETAQRLAVILLPWLALIAGFGLSRINKYAAGVFLAAYALVNYNIRFLIDIINLPF